MPVSSSWPSQSTCLWKIAKTWLIATKNHAMTSKIDIADVTALIGLLSRAFAICIAAKVKPALGKMNAHLSDVSELDLIQSKYGEGNSEILMYSPVHSKGHLACACQHCDKRQSEKPECHKPDEDTGKDTDNL